MKYFLDTEFSERGPRHPVELISIGIVAEDGREFYAVSNEFDASTVNEWVKKNVLPHTFVETDGAYMIHTLSRIAEEIKAFIGNDKPEFWGYYADYDWVIFAQLFGTMMDLPDGYPMYCRDLKQWCDQIGSPKLPEQDSTEHNALHDARWNRKVYDFLLAVSGPAEPKKEADPQLGESIFVQTARKRAARQRAAYPQAEVTIDELWLREIDKRTAHAPLPAPTGDWRQGSKVKLNVYGEGGRSVCQCHNPDDAEIIVEAVNKWSKEKQ